MIVTPQEARRIIQGRQTQLRILSPAPHAGTDTPIQPGWHKPTVGRARIHSTRQQRLGDITFHEACAEGHRHTGMFKVAWVRQHDPHWINRHKVDLVAVYDDHCSIVDWILCKRFDEHWADEVCTVLELQAIHDEPRYLATQRDTLTGHADRGYTTRPSRAIDDLECVDDRTLERFARSNDEDNRALRARYRRKAFDEIVDSHGLDAARLANRDARRLAGFLERQARRAA